MAPFITYKDFWRRSIIHSVPNEQGLPDIVGSGEQFTNPRIFFEHQRNVILTRKREPKVTHFLILSKPLPILSGSIALLSVILSTCLVYSILATILSYLYTWYNLPFMCHCHITYHFTFYRHVFKPEFYVRKLIYLLQPSYFTPKRADRISVL